LTPAGSGASTVIDTTGTVRRASRGDAAAFALLCHSRAPGVIAYLGAVCPDAAERDQLTRRVFVRAWRELPSLDKPLRFDLWLLRLTYAQVGAL
jgi:RNA polymerase sigma-70 factor (ECF subfamily)